MAKKARPICPKCGERAERTKTQYGLRNACCGLHSWGYKPLVAPEVHQLRQAFHRAFDPLWHSGAFSRGAAYLELSAATELPEHECHGAKQSDPEKLRRLITASREIGRRHHRGTQQ